MPRLSIITVVYNGEHALADTIASVTAQTARRDIEYIIIDGNSKDGTRAVMAAHADEIDRAISEPDNGLYDAMNKGLRLATGDFVWFVNAGDTIADADTAAQILAKATAETDILYGEVAIVDENRSILGTRSALSTQKLPRALTWQSLRYGMVVSHQGFVPRRAIVAPYMLGNLAADIDWVINALKKARNVVEVPLVVAHFQTGGISTQRHNESLRDRFQVLQHHFGVIPNLAAHAWIAVRAAWKKMVSINC